MDREEGSEQVDGPPVRLGGGKAPVRPVIRTGLACGSLLAVWLLAFPGSAVGSPMQSEAVGAARSAAQIADRMAAYYPIGQKRNGAFPDYVNDLAPGWMRNRYGPAVMGGALVISGVRTGNVRSVESGLRSVRLTLRTRSGIERSDPKGRPRKTFEYPFSMLGIVEAWRALRSPAGRRLSSRFDRRSLRTAGSIRREISRLAPIPEKADGSRWSDGQNRILLERLVWLEAISTGIEPAPGIRGSVLRRPDRTGLRIERFLEGWLSGRPRGTPIGDPAGPLLLASDSPRWPLSYHALSAALLARVLPLTSGPLRSRLGVALRDAVRATNFLVSPDGDLAYAGRSSMHSWTLSLAAYAALATSRVPGIPSEELAANRGLAGLLVDRLSECCLQDDGRLMITPGLNPSPERAVSTLDPYAAEVPYAGLTMLGLEWAAAERDGPRLPLDPTSGYAWADRGAAAMATARTDGLWMALRAVDPDPGDRRLDLGPVAAKQFVGDRWEWLIPPRPPGPGGGPERWLDLRDGERRLSSVSAEIARQDGGWGHLIGYGAPGSPAEREVILEYRPAGCGGVEIELGPVDAVVSMSFWLPGGRVEIESDGVVGPGLRLSVSRPVGFEVAPVTPGPAHPELVPVTALLGQATEATTLTLCRTG